MKFYKQTLIPGSGIGVIREDGKILPEKGIFLSSNPITVCADQRRALLKIATKIEQEKQRYL